MAIAYCVRCNRPLNSEESQKRGMGHTCAAKSLKDRVKAGLDLNIWPGYAYIDEGNGEYLLITPRHDQYHCNTILMQCDCPAWRRDKPCKHLGFIIMEESVRR